ncbi:ApeA N-terminal domain 1-containing protein [Solicola gregarius]|uniref:ApeA N-terminal domain-containing protein n=1 Tax=Solicola gregarius TaxID=2908642 RepID=A0AA46TM89_9ACTN|nr:HEPN domain-containing protein [Solicola gregarius]UYM07519.1 hypothetical protein L0C25_10750 [Solicola gregarius]
MTGNDLASGDSRVGWAWDAKLTTPYVAMLRDREHQVELVIPYDPSDEALHRRYAGSMVRWGDDPERSRFDYELPDQFWFMDARGFVSLNGIRAHAVEPIAGGPTIFNQCRVAVDYAVFSGTPGVDYSVVNGLSTRVEGLGQWFGHRSVRDNLLDPERSNEEFSLTITSPRTQRLDAGLNLSIVAGADWRLPGEPGLTHLEEVGSIRTTMQRARPWEEHIERHWAVHQLLEISAWKPLGFQQAKVMHRRDPQRVLSGKRVGDQWAPVKTYSLPGSQGKDGVDFLFTFQDIGATGVRRWLRVRDRFSRGIHAMTFSIQNSGTSLDGLISDAGIGLEELGHTIDVLRGGGARRAHHAHLRDLAAEVDDLLPFSGAEWATESTELYNDVKHADRRDPTAAELYGMLIKNRLVFRVWMARRIGVSDTVIGKGMWRLRRGLPDT